MNYDTEIYPFLLRHLQSIMDNDVNTYHETTADDLTLYEWYVTPHRLDGLPFHEFMMQENARRGENIAGYASDPEDPINTRFDLANLHIQRYGNTAIASYTLLISTGLRSGVHVAAHNESRTMIRINMDWKVVHVHKSPAWPAPHLQPL